MISLAYIETYYWPYGKYTAYTVQKGVGVLAPFPRVPYRPAMRDEPTQLRPATPDTGAVRIDAPFSGSGNLSGATVTFEPGARTAWHTHPLGQTLLVTAGLGRVQRERGPIEEIRAGDIVWFEPGEKHWHGAAPDCAMTHIAIAEMQDGKAVTWMEKVTNEQYAGEVG